MSHMTGMTEAQALASYRAWTGGISPEGCDMPPADWAKQLDDWQEALDEVREHLGHDATPEAREFMAAEQARIDGLR